MKNLKYIILGSAITIALFSVIEKLVQLILLWIDVAKISPSKKLLNYQKDTQIIKEFLKPICPVHDDYVDLDDFEEDYDDEE